MKVRDNASSCSYSSTAHTLPTQDMKRLEEQYEDVLSRLKAQEEIEEKVARAQEALAQAAEAARNGNRQKRSAMKTLDGSGSLQPSSAKKRAVAVTGKESECGLCVPV